MIIEFQTKSILLSQPVQWWLYYKDDYETHFNKISVTYEQLKLFLETYGYETNDIFQLQQFDINTKNIKHTIKLK